MNISTDLNETATRSGSPPCVFSPGRPPWFEIRPQAASPTDLAQAHNTKTETPGASDSNALCKTFDTFVIGIAGGSASGKTSVSEMVIKNMDVPWVVLLCMDAFYKNLTPEQIAQAHCNDYNFDHPDAFDYDLLLETLTKLKAGKNVEVPIYDFKTHSRLDRKRYVYGANVIIFEGILALYDPRILELMDLKVFVDTDDDIRLARRLKRDISERGRDLHGVLQQYNRFVKPSFDEFIRPTMRYADMIIPRGADNTMAISLLTKHIVRQLDERGFSVRSQLAQLHLDLSKGTCELPHNIIVMEAKPQLKFIHTMMRDRTTSRDDFVFFADRLSRLAVERALSELPFQAKSVTTPTLCTYQGLERASTQLCGVSIVRGGVPMERGLRKVCEGISIGKLLIQTDPRTLEPQLHYCKLPDGISGYRILLMDATIATGAAAIMAVRVLLDHDVPQESIIFVSFIASPQGLVALISAFPKIKIVVSQVDWDGLNEQYWIKPGLGNFGDRYFGTD